MKLLTLFFLFLTANVNSQSLSPDEKMLNYPSASGCGLVTRWSSNLIPPECLTEAKNVYFDQDLSISRRNGYVQYNATPCTDSKSIRGMWNYDSTDGQRFIVINSSGSFFYTKDQGDCLPIVGLSGLNETAQYECVQALGELYCTNGINIPFSTTISTFNFIPSMPLGSKIATFRNRIAIANAPGQLSRILLSGEGDGSDWTLDIPGFSTSPASIDISGLNDGKPIMALMGVYQNAFYIGRDDDLWALYGNDRRDFTLRQISTQIGVMDSHSVREKNNCLHWLSRRGIEGMCGTTIERMSDGVRDILDGIIQSAGNTRTKTYDSEAQWEAGLYNAHLTNQGPLSTTIYPGSIVPSTWTSLTTPMDWNSGTLVNISSSDITSFISISTTTFNKTIDDFSDGNYTSNPTWTCGGDTGDCGRLSVSNSYLLINGTGWVNGVISSFYTTNPLSFINLQKTYNLRYDLYYHYSESLLNTYFFLTSDSINPTNGYYLLISYTENAGQYTGTANAGLYKRDSGVDTLLGSNNLSIIPGDLAYLQCSTITINYSAINNIITAYSPDCGINISANADLSILSSTYSVITSSFTRGNIYISSITEYGNTPYYNGTYTSPIYDTGLSTPIGGPFNYDGIIPIGSTVAFSVRESSYSSLSGMGNWNLVSTTTSGAYTIPLTKEFWQYKADLSTQYSTQTPAIDLISLEATTTGFYIADCVDVAGISSWGNFRPSYMLSPGNVIDYAVNSGNSCNQVTRDTATWTTQLENTPISVSTNTFLGIRVYEQPITTTDTVRLNAITVEWNEGSSRPPVASQIYMDRYYMFYTTNTNVGSINDHALVLDMNNKWSLLDDIYADSSVIYDEKMYTGDSRNTGLLHIQDTGTDDSGGQYDFKIKTSDYDFGNPVQRKKLKRVYMTFKSEIVVGQNINLTLKYYIDGSTTAYSLSSVGMDEAQQPGYFVAKFPAINEIPSIFHWLSLSVEYNGSQGPVSIDGIKVIYSEQRFD